MALRSDGTVVAWGSDQDGQLGSGRLNYETRPGLVTGLSAVRNIGSGSNHVLAVREDGTVWAWGRNNDGQLGGGSSANRASPTQVQGITNVAMTCGGDYYSMALKADGSVWAWGANYDGVLGDGTQNNSSVPIPLAALSSVSAIACGNNHVLALRQDGTVWAWGSNAEGALGDGSTTMRLQPVQVPGLTSVVSIAAGQDFSAALKQDGTVWEWGILAPYANPRGAPRVLPVQAAGVSGAVAIAASLNSFWLLAIQLDQQTWWRWETGTTPALQDPVGNLKAAAAGYGQTLLLKSDATVLAFGYNGNPFGNLGDGTTNYRQTPGPVVDISNIVQVATGTWHGLALDANGKVWSWGLDSAGQLGRGRILSRSVPADIAGLNNIVQVSAGYNHNLAVDQDGSVWVWGDNSYGELGDGSYLGSSSPIRLSSISNVKAVAAGAFYSLALKRDGTVWEWGSVLSGASADPSKPSLVLDNAIAIAAGDVHGLALNPDGTVWAWGGNYAGQLGDGTKIDRAQPQPVAGLSDVKLIAASRTSSYAVRTDSTVMAWGENSRGQLGDGTTSERQTPVVVAGLNGVVEFSAGLAHALARKGDGSVWGWSWDYETSGELGSAPTTTLSIAAPVAGVNAIQQVSAGAYVTGLVRQDGQVLMGGKNFAGQLGDGTFAQHPDFVLAVNPEANGFLQLNGIAPIEPPPELKVPFFVSSTGGISDTSAVLKTTTKFNAADAGKSGAVFVTAMVPAGSVGTLQSVAKIMDQAAAATQAAAADSSFVLLQLTATGWQQVVNGQLIPYASGVLGDQLAAQTILNGTDTTNLKGAQYCLGYGTSADDMIATGKMRAVATIPTNPSATSTATVSCIVSKPAAGIWWNPAEGGRGFVIEQRGNTLFLGAFLYDSSGRPTWYAASGSTSGNFFSGSLSTYASGQTLTGPYVAPLVTGSAGNVSITFSDTSHGTLTWPGGTIPIQRFDIVTGGAAMTPPAGTPETGIWWNPAESGRGFALEIQAGTMFLGGYMFDASGDPIWYSSGQTPMTDAMTYVGVWEQYGNGQTMTGTYKPATLVNSNVGAVRIEFSDTQNAILTLPDDRQIPITRFRF